ncbi:MAG: IS3 family transposase [Propionibacteriaceae bacterium]|nr:IS3 family transposase [Propionibacteriaceae bacterium]
MHTENFGDGPRQVWLVLNREGIPVARYNVERLMTAAGLVGVVRGKVKRTTIARAGPKPDDRVQRKFEPLAPNRLRVADFTYVPTWAGWVFRRVRDRRLRPPHPRLAHRHQHDHRAGPGRHQASHLDRQTEGHDQFEQLVAHNDRGVQYLSVVTQNDSPRRASRRRSAGSAPASTTPWPIASRARQDRSDPPPGTLAQPRHRRDRHRRIDRLVQQPAAQPVLRRHAPAVLEQVHCAQQQPSAAR